MISSDPIERQRTGLLAALLALSASSLHFEVLLTKFFANKLEHHYTFAVISLALLGFGAGGVFVQLRPASSPDPSLLALRLSRYAAAFALAMPLSIALFVMLPFDPAAPGLAGALALPVYFLLFAATFFPAGVCVSALLAAPGLTAGRVYAWDLIGAGLGAALGPALLPLAGGYGSVVIASCLALFASAVMRSRAGPGARRSISFATLAVAVACLLTLIVPRVLRGVIGFDMLSFKYTTLRDEFLGFGPPAQVYWNPIARVDVSPSGTSVIGGFRYGLARSLWNAPLAGRMILVDGSANTRQWLLEHRPDRTSMPARTLWSLPYVMRPEGKRALIIGPGGGVDILVGKAMGATEIDAVELNPDVYRLLAGRLEDREGEAYVRLLRSDDQTRVSLFNAEARHFAHARRGQRTYDVVLASGVDTLTAIQTAGNALSENFLYTRDAVEDYVSLLEPGGQLALTHWHLDDPKGGYSPTLPLKMLVTYLEVLERAGAPEPGRRVCVVSEGFWESSLLKKDQDYTEEEVARLRAFASDNGFQVVYDPFMAQDAPVLRTRDVLFRQLARASKSERATLLATLPWKLEPATDDRPYFYWIRSNRGGLAVFDDGGWIFPQSSVRWMFMVALLASLGMVAAPAIRARRAPGFGTTLRSLPFFAATGLAFVFAENALFLLLTLVVGGPFWSIAVVLPSMLIGYGAGSWLGGKVVPARRSGALGLAVAFALGFAIVAALAAWGLPALMGYGTVVRIAAAAAMVVPFGALLGTAVPWFMDLLRSRRGGDPNLPWLWAVSSASNVLGSLVFVPFCAQLGVRWTFGLSAALYVAALLGAAAIGSREPVSAGDR